MNNRSQTLALLLGAVLPAIAQMAVAQTPTPTATPRTTFIDSTKTPSRFLAFPLAPGINIPAFLLVDENGDPASLSGGGGGGGAVTIANGADVTLGAKADAKSTATDTTAISVVSILKQISASVQAPPSQVVTGPLTDTQLRATAVPVSIADGIDVTQGAKADAKSTATDTTPISVVSILKQISASVQAPPSQAVTGPLTDTQLRATAVPVAAAQVQFTGTPSSFTIGTSDQTVFTLSAGGVGFIQNLDDAPLAVKQGASASTSSLSFILAAGVAADDGTGGAIKITDWVGAVSVAAMTGSPRYIAWKQAP